MATPHDTPVQDTDYAALVQDDRVHTALYKDGAIFDEEMERIFKNTWVWVGHDSELPGPNTFKKSFVGNQPVIVTRDKAGRCTLLNRCRHRAASVCEKKKGKPVVFVCPYHGWSYDIDGNLRKVPYADGYARASTEPARPVALRTEVYQGMIYATFRDDIDAAGRLPGPGEEVDGPVHEAGRGFRRAGAGRAPFRFPGNWKIQLENTTDAYHFPIVHKTFLDSRMRRPRTSSM
jgi:phenylpropionate dioxygenase-like ring-hydroxylating dioxygenase large terminal subunit